MNAQDRRTTVTSLLPVQTRVVHTPARAARDTLETVSSAFIMQVRPVSDCNN